MLQLEIFTSFWSYFEKLRSLLGKKAAWQGIQATGSQLKKQEHRGEMAGNEKLLPTRTKYKKSLILSTVNFMGSWRILCSEVLLKKWLKRTQALASATTRLTLLVQHACEFPSCATWQVCTWSFAQLEQAKEHVQTCIGVVLLTQTTNGTFNLVFFCGYCCIVW
jgi:hypothetical protein